MTSDSNFFLSILTPVTENALPNLKMSNLSVTRWNTVPSKLFSILDRTQSKSMGASNRVNANCCARVSHTFNLNSGTVFLMMQASSVSPRVDMVMYPGSGPLSSLLTLTGFGPSNWIQFSKCQWCLTVYFCYPGTPPLYSEPIWRAHEL